MSNTDNITCKLNRCDKCGMLSEDVDIRNGVRLCPECMGLYADADEEPSGIDDLAELGEYGADRREDMLEEIAEIRGELGFDDIDAADLEADAEAARLAEAELPVAAGF